MESLAFKVMSSPFPDPAPGDDVLWRVESKRYSYVIDPDAERYGTTAPRLELFWFRVIKRTPCGAWIDGRFVNLKARKKFACNTKEEALECFRRRKEVHVSILKAQLAAAQKDLALAIGAINARPSQTQNPR